MDDSRYNKEGWRPFFVLIMVGVILLACLSIWILNQIDNRQPQKVAQPQIFPSATATQIFLPLPTVAPSPTPHSAFAPGTHWYPFRCTGETPARCTFVQQGNTAEFWGACLEPEKPRPVTFQEDSINHDWYVMGEGLILYPLWAGSNLQSFKLLEEGQK